MNRDVTRVMGQIKSCLRCISYCMKNKIKIETDRQIDRACISESVPSRRGNRGWGGGGVITKRTTEEETSTTKTTPVAEGLKSEGGKIKRAK